MIRHRVSNKIAAKNIAQITFGFVIYLLIINLICHLYLQQIQSLLNLQSLLTEYDFKTEIWANIVFGFLGGLIFSSVEVLYLSNKFKGKPYAYSIFVKGAFHFLIIIFFLTAASFFYHSINLHLFPLKEEVITKVSNFMSGYGGLKNLIVIWIGFHLFLIILQLNQHIGPGMFWQFLSGKYHNSKEQFKIFMFLDIKSSTGIAEKIGHEKYFKFMNYFFEDVTYPILYNKGEIYQYVGDEIVISWSPKSGVMNSNCVRCFFDIENAIKENSEKYLKMFGLIPEFKAAIHFGKVTTGEIGIIKKEIVHTGDVLNTTARIQSLCNEYNQKLIISTDLMDILNLQKEYILHNLGEIKLKGRSKKVNILGVGMNSKTVANKK